MSHSRDRQDELFSIAIGARRRDAKPVKDSGQTIIPDAPTPKDDAFTDFVRSLSEKQCELFRAYLENP